MIGGWVGYSIGRLYFDHDSLKNQITDLADQALLAPRMDVKKKLLDMLTSYRVDVDPEKVTVDMPPTREYITIAFSYEKTLNFIVTQHTFPFEMDIQRRGGKAGGIVQSVQDSIEDSNAASARKYQDAVKSATGAGQ